MRTASSPRNTPRIPTIEANSDGAGIGSFRRAKTTPAIKPVRSDLKSKNISICIIVICLDVLLFIYIIYPIDNTTRCQANT